MPALQPHVLYARLQAALPAGSTIQSAADETHPMLVDVPGFGPVRAYLWTITRDQSAEGARPPDEFKMQLTHPSWIRGQRHSLDLSAPYLTVLLGYSPDFGVFGGWDARFYTDFGDSPNLQVKEGLLIDGRDSGWAVAPPRHVTAGDEVRVAFSPGNLGHYLNVTKQANAQNREGHAREAFFLFNTPNAALAAPPATPEAQREYVERQRERIAANRLSRDTQFSPRVREQYGYSCAICGIQMEAIESAHIIPVAQEGSSDDVSNGIALCATHHKLFDSYVLVVRPTLEIVVNNAAVQYLRDRGRDQGIDYFVLRHGGQQLRPPDFFTTDQTRRDAMVNALTERAQRAGLV
jgi:putative restriction endonuclease